MHPRHDRTDLAVLAEVAVEVAASRALRFRYSRYDTDPSRQELLDLNASWDGKRSELENPADGWPSPRSGLCGVLK